MANATVNVKFPVLGIFEKAAGNFGQTHRSCHIYWGNWESFLWDFSLTDKRI